MNKNSFIKKTSLLLIVAILSLNLSFLTVPKQAQATWPSIDYAKIAQDAWQWVEKNWKDYAIYLLKTAAKSAARQFIMRITQSTVDWINNGALEGKGGQPAFVADFNKFMTGEGGVLDRAVGDFLGQTDMAFLCDPFKAQVSLALQIGYSDFRLRDKLGCTLTSVNRNIDNALRTSGVNLSVNAGAIQTCIDQYYDEDGNNLDESAPYTAGNKPVDPDYGGATITQCGNAVNGFTADLEGRSDFVSSGGWDNWLENTMNPQNNPVGAYLIAKNELEQKLAQEEEVKKEELSQGQGALSFQRCTDTYFDQKGNKVGESKEYTVGTGENDDRPRVPVGVDAERKCVVKTPGSAVTEMLGFKATSDQRMGELTATLSDGVDAIFGALMNQVIQIGLGQLRNGVLGNNSAANNAYNASLNAQRIAANNAAVNANNRANLAGANIGANSPGLVATIPTAIAPITINSSLFGIVSTTSTSTVSIPIPTSGSGFGGAFDQAKNNAIILLNSLSSSESAYQNNHLIAQNVLTQGRATFATSSVCNINYNRTSSVLRASLIRSNVLTNIDGIPDSGRSIASIPWNLVVINAALTVSNTNMTTLSTAASGVNGATDISAITTAMIPVNSTNFNTDPQAGLVPNIKTWLSGARNLYNSLICPIDLTSVLQINSPATP